MFKECFIEPEGESIKDFVQQDTFAPEGFTCDECLAEQPAGSRMQLATGHCDGEPFKFQTCVTCQAVKRDFCPSAPFGALWDYIEIEYGLTLTGFSDWSTGG